VPECSVSGVWVVDMVRETVPGRQTSNGKSSAAKLTQINWGLTVLSAQIGYIMP